MFKSILFTNYIKFNRRVNILGLASAVILFLLTLMLFLPLYHKSETTTATIGTANAADTSLSLSSANSGTASVTLDVTSPTGTFASSSDSTSASFSVTSNNYTGYTLSISPASTSQTNTLSSGSATFDELPNAVTADNFSSSSSLNGKWGYTFYKSGSSATNYYPGSTSDNQIDETSSANSTANTYYIGLGVRASYSQAAGTYNNSTSNNSYILTATSNPIAYRINFLDTSNDASVANLPSALSESVSAVNINLTNDKIPTRTGYTFKSWCLGTVSHPASANTVCTGKEFTKDSTFGIDQTADNRNINLYAVWTINYYTQNTYVRYQDAAGGWGDYALADSQSVIYGGTYSWGRAADAYFQYAGTSYAVTANKDNYIDIYRQVYSCYIQSRHENPDGSFTGYTARVNQYQYAGSTCAWSIAADANHQAASYSVEMTGQVSASLDIMRNWYYLNVVPADATISSTTGSGWYRAEQTAYITATPAQGYDFSYWYLPGATWTDNAYSSGAWVTTPNYATTFYAYGKLAKIYIWNATSANCGQTLYDNRDGTERAYTTKMVNSLCWMTTNLALGTSYAVQLNSATTNLAPGTTYNLPASSTSGFSNNAAQNVYNAGFAECTGAASCYGYYTYSAATAGINPSYGIASYDICPANWRLPTQAEFNALQTSYSTSAALVSNWSAVYSGTCALNSCAGGAAIGSYWSSTAYKAGYAYFLNLPYASKADVRGDEKSIGRSIRCVAKS